MTINSFQGEYRFLSNFWYVPGGVMLNDIDNIGEILAIVYPTVEHGYVAAKTTHLNTRRIISQIDKPGEAKRVGRTIKLRDDWESVKLDIMLSLLRQKFQVPELAYKLLSTGDQQLIEGNTWHDNFWGICSCYRCEYLTKVNCNNLGRLLMQVREEIRHER